MCIRNFLSRSKAKLLKGPLEHELTDEVENMEFNHFDVTSFLRGFVESSMTTYLFVVFQEKLFVNFCRTCSIFKKHPPGIDYLENRTCVRKDNSRIHNYLLQSRVETSRYTSTLVSVIQINVLENSNTVA